MITIFLPAFHQLQILLTELALLSQLEKLNSEKELVKHCLVNHRYDKICNFSTGGKIMN